MQLILHLSAPVLPDHAFNLSCLIRRSRVVVAEFFPDEGADLMARRAVVRGERVDRFTFSVTRPHLGQVPRVIYSFSCGCGGGGTHCVAPKKSWIEWTRD